MMQWPIYEKHESYKDSGIDWLGPIPDKWAMQRSKLVWRETAGRSISGSEELLSVSQYHGIVPRTADSRSEDLTGYKLVNKGELVTNIMLAWMGSLGISEHRGIVSPAYAVYELIMESNPQFLGYLYKTPQYLAEFARRSSGVVPSRWRMYTDDFGQVPTLLPPANEQNAIVAFLDAKCAKIDEAVKIKEGQIALLSERRQIIIEEAVTRGLNPAAPMKDSGIDWIGRIPAHWDNMPNKYLFQLKKDTVGKRSGQYELLSLTLRGIIKRDMENPEGKFPAEFDTYQEVCPGDFVFCHFDVEETPRTVGLSEFFGMITGAYTVYSVAHGVDPRFLLHFYIFADTDKKMRGMYKGLRNTIPKDAFGAFKTPLPPIAEQRAIVAHIDDASRKIEDGIAIKERQITALKEYKTGLINAAVTGKIKVS